MLDFALLCGILRCRLNSITRLYGGLPMRNGFKHFIVVLTVWLATNGSESEGKEGDSLPAIDSVCVINDST